MKTRLVLPGLFAALLLASSPSLPAQTPAPLMVYNTNLVNGWQDWSYIPHNLANTSPVYNGGLFSISASANVNNYQGLSFEQPIFNSYQGGFNNSVYQNFVFWANGGSAGGQILNVYAQYGANGTSGAGYQLPALTVNTWTQFTVPLSSILPAGTTNLKQIGIQITPNGKTNTFYVSDLYFTGQPAPALQHLSVNASNTLRIADSRWFGANTSIGDGYLDTSYTTNALNQAGIDSLRFPGGSDADEYNWVTGETTAYTTGGTAGTVSTYPMNFNNFMHVATNVGAQAFITVNYGSGTSNEAAAWVLNANVTNHCNFKYWEVGNECFGNWETDTNSPPWSPYTYAVRFAGYYALMKAADPTIKVGAPATTGEDSFATYTTHPATNSVTHVVHNGWTPVMLATMKRLGVTPDFLVYHFYPENTAYTSPPPASDCDALVLQVSSQVAGDAANYRMMLTDYLGPSASNTELVCTENNSDAGAMGRQSTSLVNALYLADTIGQIMKTEINAYTFFCLRAGPPGYGNFDPTIYGWRTYGDYGLIDGANSYYPTYYAMSLMPYLAPPGATILNASSDYLLLTPYAARGADGSLRLLVLNKDTNATFTAQISLTNFVAFSSATVYSYGKPQDGATESNLSLSLQQISVSNYPSFSTLFTNAFPPLSLTLFDFAPVTPVVAVQPQSQTCPIGGNVTFTTSATGTPPLYYQWLFNTTNLTDNGQIMGSQSNVLTLTGVTMANAGAYQLVVTNAFGSVTSSIATLTLTLVLNGGFATGDFTDWTLAGDTSYAYVDNGNLSGIKPHSGSYEGVLGTTSSPGSLSQTLSTTAGASYLVSFWINNFFEDTNEFSVSWDGSPLFDTTNLVADTWTYMQFVASATGPATVLQFDYEDDVDWLALDDVSVVAVPGIAGICLSGTNLIINGNNGFGGTTCYVLMSTNLTLPVNQWTPVATNVLSTNGNFSITATNAVNGNTPQQFYILEVP